jgi:hypothetical protein
MSGEIKFVARPVIRVIKGVSGLCSSKKRDETGKRRLARPDQDRREEWATQKKGGKIRSGQATIGKK